MRCFVRPRVVAVLSWLPSFTGSVFSKGNGRDIGSYLQGARRHLGGCLQFSLPDHIQTAQMLATQRE